MAGTLEAASIEASPKQRLQARLEEACLTCFGRVLAAAEGLDVPADASACVQDVDYDVRYGRDLVKGSLICVLATQLTNQTVGEK